MTLPRAAGLALLLALGGPHAGATGDEPLAVTRSIAIADFGWAGAATWNHPLAGHRCDPRSPFNGIDSVWLDVAGRGGQRFVVQPEPHLNVLVDVYDAACRHLGGSNSGRAGEAERGTLPASAANLHVVGYGSTALSESSSLPGPGGAFTARVG